MGIGASAGGLAAVRDLLTHLPSDVGAAFVIIQHLDPKHGSLTPDILARVSPIPVHEVQDGMAIEKGHVYVIPPNRNMRLERGILKLTPRTETRGQHLPIDLFFQSLADDRRDLAIGVVLSGIASDGTMGVQAIKGEGGLTFAQEPRSAQYDGMPRSAIVSGAVDVIETPEGIAREIAKVSAHLSSRPDLAKPIGGPIEGPIGRGPNGNLRKIFGLIRSATGIDFSLYKYSTIQRRIARRLLLLKMEDLQTYTSYLSAHPEEVQSLFSDILIHVTAFFRDPEAFEALQARLLREQLKNWDPSVPFRIWVPGCSTGEEAYSLAILLSEVLGKVKGHPSLQLFASDISDSSLKKARAGVYPETVAKDISKTRLARFFDKVDAGYRINKKIRELCLFSKHDLTSDPPFAKIDLISCRNVLIYFAPDLQKRVVPVLHYALNPGGILWLGRSETLAAFGSLFTLEDRANKFYSKKTTALAPRFHFPAHRESPQPLPIPLRKMAIGVPALEAVHAEAGRVAIARYVPPGVVINDAGDVLHVQGRPVPFLELTTGQASLNIFKLAHHDIVADLRYLLAVARRENAVAQKVGLNLRTGTAVTVVGITVVPLRALSPSTERCYSIFFEAALVQPEAAGKEGRKKSAAKSKHRSDGLDQAIELRDYQQQLIEEYETTQEELVSSNEELQSTNEELQSTNEELETAKEELQSANEEMTTINDELQTRNAEMMQLGNDLTNLLASVDIPIVMVGPDARVRRFTPKARQALNLIPTDIGRSIGDIRPAIQTPDLDEVVAEVMSTLSMKELETRDKTGAWYRLQVRPYRTSDNRIDGAVISLVDINDLKRSAAELSNARDDARQIIATMPTPSLTIGFDRRVQMANGAFYSLFTCERTDVEGKSVFELGDGRWNIPSLLSALDVLFNRGTAFRDLPIAQDFPSVGHRDLLVHGTATRLIGSPDTNTALLAIEDLTERKRVDARLRETEARYRHLMENANDGVLIVNDKGIIEFANRRLEAMFGYSTGELKDQTYERLIPSELQDVHRRHHDAFMRAPEPRDMGREIDLSGCRKDGTVFPVEISLTPLRVDSAALAIGAMVRDISGRRRREVEQQLLVTRETDARQQAERASIMKDEFLATLSHELRTPLTTILSWVQVLRLGGVEPEEVNRALAVIEKSAQDQSQLIDDLLDVSRIQEGKLSLQPRKISPHDSLRAAVDSVWRQADSKSLRIDTDFDPSVDTMTADPVRLEQVFRNLLSNAVKFTPHGGTITVRSKVNRDRGEIEFRVEDTGKGIRPEFLPFLFTRFSQEDASATRAHFGLGLGLAIVRELVEKHGGAVKAFSPGEGQGSIFTVILPYERGDRPQVGVASTESQRTADKGSEQLPDLSGVRALVIDDLEDARAALSAMLQTCHAQVETAWSAPAGLTALEAFKPDVVLCDLAMPQTGGLDFVRSLRQLDPGHGGETPAVAVTAYAGTENERKALEAGFDAHIAKPVDIGELTRLVSKVSAGKKKG